MSELDFKKLSSTVIGKGAKILGNLIGSPAGGVMAALVAAAFEADPANQDEIITKINADPEGAQKLLEIEKKHKEKLDELAIESAKIELDREKVHLADIQSARQRELTFIEKTGKVNYFHYVLAGFVFFGFFVLTGLLIFAPIDLNEDIKPVLNLLFGGLVSGFATVLAYYFGSSKGSADKNALLGSSSKPEKK